MKYKNNLILKKLLLAFMLLVFSINITYAYEANIKVSVNGRDLVMDVPPVVKSGRTLVPFRAIFESLDSKVSWDSKLQMAIGESDKYIVKVPIKSNKITRINKNTKKAETILVDQAATTINGRLLVPTRAIAETLDKKVYWDSRDRAVVIIDTEAIMSKSNEKMKNFNSLINIDLSNLNGTTKSKIKTSNSILGEEFNVDTNFIISKSSESIKISGELTSNTSTSIYEKLLEKDIITKDIYDKVKDFDLAKGKLINFDFYGDSSMLYMKSNYNFREGAYLLSKDLENYSLDNLKLGTGNLNSLNVANLINNKQVTFKEAKNLRLVEELTYELLSDKRVIKSISSDGIETYKYKITKMDLLNALKKANENLGNESSKLDMDDIVKFLKNKINLEFEIVKYKNIINSFNIKADIDICGDNNERYSYYIDTTYIKENVYNTKPDITHAKNINKYKKY